MLQQQPGRERGHLDIGVLPVLPVLVSGPHLNEVVKIPGGRRSLGDSELNLYPCHLSGSFLKNKKRINWIMTENQRESTFLMACAPRAPLLTLFFDEVF